MTYILSYIGCM